MRNIGIQLATVLDYLHQQQPRIHTMILRYKLASTTWPTSLPGVAIMSMHLMRMVVVSLVRMLSGSQRICIALG